jgi:hypothetical protein
MNFGPLEFAAHLERKGAPRRESAAVLAARDASPAAAPARTRLSVVNGIGSLTRHDRPAQIEAVSVYEAVSMNAPSMPQQSGPVRVIVRRTARPMVLVLSSHQTVDWQLELAPDAELQAVLLSGYGESTVGGAGQATVSSIGGFYAFKRGSGEYRHLEDEVLRCTGRNIEHFQSVYSGSLFEIGAE